MKKRLLHLSFIISVAIHLFFSLTLSVFNDKPELSSKNETEVVEVEYLSDEDAQSIDTTKKRQIVEAADKPLNNEVEPEAKYLSRFNQKVIKETRAARSGKHRNSSGSPAPTASAQQSPPDETADSQQKDPSEQSQAKKRQLSQLLPKMDWGQLRPQAKVVGPRAKQPQGSPALNQGAGPSQTGDHLKDVQIGIETLLNTREFVYYSYYDRIRGRLRQHWEVAIKEKISRILKQGRHLASNQDHVTRMVITLSSAGQLIRVQVLEESGVRDLDDAAIDAFRAAAPFPNPPKGMVENDGTIKIRWDFILES